MNAKRFTAAHLLIAVWAGFIMLLTNIFQAKGFITPEAGLTFVTFLTWSCYFFSGATPKDALKSWVCMAYGILCAIIIFLVGDALGGVGMNVPYLALPIAVFVGVFLMDLSEKFPYANRVSAVYLGGATYFGMRGIPAVHALGYGKVFIGEMAYGALGFFAGFGTVSIIAFFSKKKAE